MNRIPFDISLRPQIEAGEYIIKDKFGNTLSLKDVKDGLWYFSTKFDGNDYETELVFDYPQNHLFLVPKEQPLTEFEYAVLSVISDHNSHKDSIEAFARRIAKKLLDIARKELEANYYTNVVDDKIVFKSDLHNRDLQAAYDFGKQDALKDLPKWKKCQGCTGPFIDENKLGEKFLYLNDKIIKVSDLEKLPKEE